MGQVLSCPKCGSTQITADKKGFSGKKAIIGDILVGPIGLLAGTFGSSKVLITCRACGHKFKPGEGRLISETSSYNTVQTSSNIVQTPSSISTATQQTKSKGRGCLIIIIALLLIGFIS